MNNYRRASLFLLFYLLITRFCIAQQAPAIRYVRPAPYIAGTTITPLSPQNSGGSVPPNVYSQVSTFVGTVGVFGSTDGRGTNATISSPFGLAVAPDGSTLYFSDYNNSVVRKVIAAGDVTTFAGTAHTRGYIDANGTNAQFSDPSGIAIAKNGVMYVTDYYNNMVRKIAPDGTVTSLAGLAGQRGTTDGKGTDARFFQPAGIAISPSGVIYVADTENNEIRKVLSDGTVTTFAGNPFPGSNNGNGTTASFYKPQGLVFDAAGNLYVADALNNQIRKITPSGDVTTFAGNGAAGAADGQDTAASFSSPLGITIDQAGNFYVADKTNNLIRKITPGGLVSTFAGNGSGNSMDGIGLNASFGYPGSLAIDNNGNLLVGDLSNFVIRKVALTGYTIDKPLPKGLTFDPKTGVISGKPIFASQNVTYTITAYNVYGSNSSQLNIQVNEKAPTVAKPPVISYPAHPNYTAYVAIAALSPTNTGGLVPGNNYGQVTTVAGNATPGNINGTGTAASFNGPADVIFDSSGNLFLTEVGNNDLREINSAGLVKGFGLQSIPSSGQYKFNNPYGITIDPADNIYVADKDDQQIKEVTPAGIVSTYAGDGNEATFDGPALTASFTDPFDGIFDAAGNMFVVDRGNSRIRQIDGNGEVSTVYALDTNNDPDTNLDTDVGFITIDQQGNPFIAYLNHIIKYNPATQTVANFAGSDIAGFADGNNITARFNKPIGMAMDVAGDIYVGDSGNNAIRRITPQGMVTTLAGNGNKGTADGQGTSARFSSPYGVTLDNNGNFLYVADYGNNLIRKIAVTGYSIDKQLPPGLIFNTATGVISGNPNAPSPATVYKVTAYNGGGSSVTTITIAVGEGTLLPPNISYVTPQVYQVAAAITPLSPANTGGPVPATIYGNVTTYATGTQNGINVDNNFNSLEGIVRDVAGNIFIVDQQSSSIKVLAANGTVSFIAGSGVQAFADGNGKAASFYDPYGIALDAMGNLYVADQTNSKVRKVTHGGAVTTLDATFNTPLNLVFDNSGNLFVSNNLGNNGSSTSNVSSQIVKVNSMAQQSVFVGGLSGNKNGTGTGAQLNQPNGLAFNANGDMFVADQYNHSIKEITPAGVVTTLAGSGVTGRADGTGTAASFNDPSSIWIDRTGNVFVADGSNYLVRKITPGGIVTTIAGSGIFGKANGIGAAASFSFLSGIAGDQNGNLYVADRDNNLIRKISITGYSIDKPLPAGLVFDATTGIVSGTPSSASPATDYIITAYNTAGSSSFVVNITVKENVSLNFGPIAAKTVCNADFDGGATGTPTIVYTSGNSAVAAIVNGTIHITGAGTSVITATNASGSKQQLLTVAAAITPAVTIALKGANGCQNDETTYIATTSGGGALPAYLWKVNGISQTETSAIFTSNTFNPNDIITCTLTSSEACTTTATAVSNPLTFTPLPSAIASVTITSSPTVPFCAGITVTFTAASINGGENPGYRWQLNGADVNETAATFTTSSLKNGDIVTCILSSSVQCVASPQVTSNPVVIELSPASSCVINIPNTFTPNGDGTNDQWNIAALSAYKNCTVSIFTRYGNIIYNSTGYPIAWDGTYKGSAVPVGTYYYIINLKNGAKPLSGFIAVLR